MPTGQMTLRNRMNTQALILLKDAVKFFLRKIGKSDKKKI